MEFEPSGVYLTLFAPSLAAPPHKCLWVRLPARELLDYRVIVGGFWLKMGGSCSKLAKLFAKLVAKNRFRSQGFYTVVGRALGDYVAGLPRGVVAVPSSASSDRRDDYKGGALASRKNEKTKTIKK